MTYALYAALALYAAFVIFCLVRMPKRPQPIVKASLIAAASGFFGSMGMMLSVFARSLVNENAGDMSDSYTAIMSLLLLSCCVSVWVMQRALAYQNGERT